MDTVKRILKLIRRCPRINKNIFIFHRYKNRREITEAIAKNISGAGLMFESEKFISPNRPMDLELYGPVAAKGMMLTPIFTGAKVVWVKKIHSPGSEAGCNRFRIGVQFSKIREKDRNRIITYVKKRLKD